jgi:hypothetical protein
VSRFLIFNFYGTINDAALFYMGFLPRCGVTVGAMETTTLDYLIAEHDFFGTTVQNWVVIVAFIFSFGCSLGTLRLKTSSKLNGALPTEWRQFVQLMEALPTDQAAPLWHTAQV